MADTPSIGPSQGRCTLGLTTLLVDQQSRWRGGERVLVEAYLAQQPPLGADMEAVLELILHEVLLRRERGEAPVLAEYQQRFPQLATALEIQFEVENVLGSASQALTGSPPTTVRDFRASPAPGDGEALPERLGRYQITGRLGAGGMGVVCRAHDSQLRRDVAIKVPHFRGPDQVRLAARLRFLREARAAAAVRHPNVCPIHDVGEDAGRPYVVMALVEGESLGDRLGRQGRFEDSREAVALVIQVADALAAVHAAGVVHRDVKPGNILLDRAGTPYLSDFGLARAADGEHLTEAGTLLGTPAYMAPEQAARELGAVGPWSDQYSLGVVLYHLLTGRPPFQGDPLAVLYQVGTSEPPPPSQVRPDLDPALVSLLLKALARQPRDRYRSVADFAAALRSWREQPAVAAPRALAAPTAQHRRLTLLQCGCDLFDSQTLLETLDPEEQHDLLLDFQQLCQEVAAPLGGTVVKATDHGLLICFGIPFALECAARRAVRAGLNLLDRMPSLNERLGKQHNDLHLSARVAVHSDRAVVADNSRRGERLSIVGQVLPVVDQLEHLAAPDTLVISEDTHRLLRGFAECTSLGTQKLKGTADAKTIYRVHREIAAGSVDAAGPSGLVPLFGRDREVALLQDRWEQAALGVGQVVLLVGEAGIGKSRQVHVLKEHVAGHCTGGRAALIVEWPCSTLTQNSSLFHASDCLKDVLGLGSHAGASAKLDRLAVHLEELHLASAEAVALLALLLSVPLDDRYPPLGMSPQRQKEKTFDLLLDWLHAQADRQPVLFVVEDLHWADPTTLEFIERLVGQEQGAGLLTVLTFRPEFAPSWRVRGQQTQVSLNRLSRCQTGELLLLKSGLPTLPQSVFDQVADRTDGIPLFVEEFAAMLQAGSLYAVGGTPHLADVFEDHTIPATLQDLLLARLERAAGRFEVVQLAATIGREFSYELLSAVARYSEEELQEELAKLVDAELLFQRGRLPQARYQFKHALVRDAAYQSLLKKKRQECHRRIAEALEQRFAETCAAQPELLAHHFTEGNGIARAVEYLALAGERAQQRGAAVEAVGYFNRGLELIRTLPETRERAAQEIRAHIGLAMALEWTWGSSAPQVDAHYARAQTLCQQAGGPLQLFAALYGRYRCWQLQAQQVRSQELARELLVLAEREQDPGFLVAAHRSVGRTLFFQGKHAEAVLHLEKAVAVVPTAELRAAIYRYDVVDPWVFAHAYLSLALWLLGYPERAAEQGRQALKLADGLDRAFSVAVAVRYVSWLHQFFHDLEGISALAERARVLSTEKGLLAFAGLAKIMGGWVLTARGQSDQGVAEMRQGLEELGTLTANLARTYYLALLAEACAHAGRPEEGLHALAEAQELVHANGESYWQAEIHRLEGELLLQHDPTALADAETCFHQALEVARRQQARSLELRAAMSLAQLWSRQGRSQAGHELVAAVYGAFTEGFHTHDLQTARAWLEQDRSNYG
jgi:TOMM system kinase/cyclase fusion protein